MDQHSVFSGAAKYTADSIQRCQHLAEFIKKRQAIEEEYARALRKLCKSVSLTPFQRPPPLTMDGEGARRGWSNWWPWRRAKGQRVQSGMVSEDPTKMSLWSTFYEIIDDTSQVAKSHTALAESLQHQLLEPLAASIREMEVGRGQIVEQGKKMLRDLEETADGLKKARKRFDKSNKEAVANRCALEKLTNNRTVGSSRDLERLKVKTREAEEDFSLARQAFRQQEEALKNLHSKVYIQELPRIMTKLQQQEAQRSREALSYILGLIELERRCAVMNENYANDMAYKLKTINLIGDEQRFTGAFLSVALIPPLPPQLAVAAPMTTVSPPSMATTPESLLSHGQRATTIGSPTISEIPRTLSMPPAYESQASGDDLAIGVGFTTTAGQSHHNYHQGAASTNVLLTSYAAGTGTTGIAHSRQVTAEMLPSQP